MAELSLRVVEEVAGRLMTLGVEALSDRELIALVVRHDSAGANALAQADRLLDDYGSITALSRARVEELERQLGLGPAQACALVAAFQLSRAASVEPPRQLLCADDVAAAARPLLDGARQERLLVLICDAGNRLRRVVKVAEGAVDRAPVPVREIVNAVLRHDGRAFAIAHNHPGGTPEPSEADRRATASVKAAASVVGLRFLSHIVFSDELWRETA